MSASPDHPAVLAPRAVALDLLQAVLRRRRPFDETLADHPELTRLAGRDRAFVRLLTATTLRRLGQIDRILGRCLERPLPRRAAAIQDLLRLGACQLLFLRTPPHAAVDSTVALAAGLGGEAGFKGLVNAVLRRLDREGEALLAAEADLRVNTPDWLWDSWVAAYGDATAAAIAAAHLEEPPLDITVKGDPTPWAERLDAVPLPTGSLRRATAGPVEALPGFDAGAWWVQDAAAALPARFLGPVAGKRVIDLCAAPGGKTAQLAAAGAQVTAVDRSANRLARLTENLSRLSLAAETVTADAAGWRPETPADAVLLDAPCTATGTIRRHPDVPWLKSPQDMRKLVPLQDRLLAAAVAMTASGGTLVYCVCSLQPEEGSERIATLLASDAPVERSPIEPAEVGGLAELLTQQGELRSLPCHLADRGGLAGFYAARLRRR
ncbi:transcription antitermination factor NusB [Rhodospirillaceae bacterium SYSU D60014]|uniref:RsmB/NOP family class I SAM-dependent RNA methyltransferase n=1 Tax=Virgifigura deserti TaxID=2268457 RepID=UPI000E66C111